MDRITRRVRATVRRMAIVITAVVALTASALVAVHRADAATPSAGALGPTVTKTDRGPTGYEVTFRYRAPNAAHVQIKGEWYFADPYELSALAGTSATDVVQTPGVTPDQWQPGDIPIGSPNSSAANWPVVSMTKGRNGIWTYTTPLPSGTFNYGFYVDCTATSQTGCTEVADPANPAWNVNAKGRAVGSTEPVSQVYVPSDPRFGTIDESVQAPAKRHGTLTDVTYPAPLSVTPAGKNFTAVYTPPGYDSHRATPYPTVYLNSGGSNELDWSTQGAVGNILDNLVNTGQIQPMVVVMPNTQGFPSDAQKSFGTTIVDAIVPWVEAHYNVSADPTRRAIGGLGYGASITNSVLVRHTDEFGSYGIMSPGLNADYVLPSTEELNPAEVRGIREANVFVGGGLQDPSHWFHASQVAELTALGIPTTSDFVNGGHSWYAWRLLVRDFLTRSAFFPSAGK